MNPYQQRDNLNPSKRPRSDIPNRSAPDRQQQPQDLGGIRQITPNESKRQTLLAEAQREEEAFQRFKETQRCGPVHINPERLGGDVSLQEAREKQFRESRSIKWQKKLKKEDEKRRSKELEQMEQQKKKDVQREKAERLEQKRLLDDLRRREQFELDHSRTNDRFLQQFETVAISSKSAPSPVPNTQDVTYVKRNLEEIQEEHKSKNAEFLNKIEQQMRASSQSNASSSGRESACRPQTSPEPHGEDELHSDEDFDWALMKLMSHFPQYDRDVLEEILNQCRGDYQQAHGLLSL